MRAIVQRVRKASVEVDGEIISSIDRGYLILLGVTHEDGDDEAAYLARKIAGLRLFEDDRGKMNLSLADVGGQALVVSQFTLYADARKGRRPSFTDAAPPEQAAPLVDRFVEHLRAAGVPTQTGRFQAHMLVCLCNDGPVTLILDTASMRAPKS
ncbi:MAG: D-tyrosyl-tRNA(Tyr) deacylase [Anaerolineae bacterium]|nr:D-tyrosyl-tRNA(Tyr) deacylase [Anaerolineae bacterium]